MNYQILYNPLACNGQGEEEAMKLKMLLAGNQLTFHNVTETIDYKEFFDSLSPKDHITICGGDGTLNHFVNDIAGLSVQNPILYYSTGSGNDFLRDLGKEKGGLPIQINQYLEHLPIVSVNGENHYFLNGIGYGIDGYCCEVADKQKETSKKPANYTAIAIKGLLFHYEPTTATITVDGNEHTFQKVWLAPTMNGRFYGGGMMITPKQDRLKNQTVSVGVMYGSSKLKTLAVFPSIFKGTHVKHTEMFQVLTGQSITVEFDRPTALQIDGETVLGVTKYQVTAAAF